MPDRIDKINSLIKDEVGELILTEAEFPPDTLVTVTAGVTSKDMHYAKVFVSVLPINHAGQVLKILEKTRLRKILFKKLSIKFIPILQYHIDDTEAKAQDIEGLLDQLRKKV